MGWALGVTWHDAYDLGEIAVSSPEEDLNSCPGSKPVAWVKPGILAAMGARARSKAALALSLFESGSISRGKHCKKTGTSLLF